jgi:hypothetical protein
MRLLLLLALLVGTVGCDDPRVPRVEVQTYGATTNQILAEHYAWVRAFGDSMAARQERYRRSDVRGCCCPSRAERDSMGAASKRSARKAGGQP